MHIVSTSTAKQSASPDIAVLDELSRLGMQLARLMVRQAEVAQDAQLDPAAKTAGHAPAFAPAFASISRAIQSGIALRSRLAAGQTPPEEAAPVQPETANDPRRPSIAAYLHKVVDALAHHPNRRVLHHTIEARIDKLLAADPGYTVPGSDIVIPICTALGLPYDLAKMHDDLIFPVGRTRKRRIPKLGLDDDPDILGNGHDLQ